MKLMNFYGIEYPGKGLTNASKLDRTIYEEFAVDRNNLESIAAIIRKIVTSGVHYDSSSDDEKGGREGALLEKLHKYKERNRALAEKKKAQALKNLGYLKCDVCDFVFKDKYGSLGEGFMECHHIIPLSEIEIEQETKLKDLSLVCANCHRMLHRKGPRLTIEQLREIVQSLN